MRTTVVLGGLRVKSLISILNLPPRDPRLRYSRLTRDLPSMTPEFCPSAHQNYSQDVPTKFALCERNIAMFLFVWLEFEVLSTNVVIESR